jgi:1-acyl-sn-glycerol-3-phosphate acyltransferase
MDIFRSGVEKILERNPVPVVPMALQGLWGTFFTHGRSAIPRNWMAKVRLIIGRPVPPSTASAASLQEEVRKLLEFTDG